MAAASERLRVAGARERARLGPTHDFVIRLAPPLVICRDDLGWMLDRIRTAFA